MTLLSHKFVRYAKAVDIVLTPRERRAMLDAEGPKFAACGTIPEG